MRNKCSKLAVMDLSNIERVTISSRMNGVRMRNKCSKLAVTDLSNIERVTVSSRVNGVKYSYFVRFLNLLYFFNQDNI